MDTAKTNTRSPDQGLENGPPSLAVLLGPQTKGQKKAFCPSPGAQARQNHKTEQEELMGRRQPGRPDQAKARPAGARAMWGQQTDWLSQKLQPLGNRDDVPASKAHVSALTWGLVAPK